MKALVATPTVLDMMNDQLDWTTELGDAVLAQQADVMDAIQRLRAKAQANGKLETTKQQKVTVTQQEPDKQVIVIEPASPETVYVPYYDPRWSTARGPIPTIRPITFRLRRAGSWAARSRAALPGARPSPSATRSGTILRLAPRQHQCRHRQEREHRPQRIDVNVGKWEHNSYHRRGVNYDNPR